MSCRVDSTLIAGACVVGNRGLGVLGSVIRATTAVGDAGPGFLYNDWQAGDDNKEFRGLILTPPASGTLFANEDGSFEFTAPADGTYSFTYRLFVDGADMGTATASFTVGETSPVVATVSAVAAAAFSAVAGVSAEILGTGFVTATVSAVAAATFSAVATVTAEVIATPVNTEPVTLAEAKQAARISGTSEFDDLIPGLISSARQMAEQETGREFVRKTKRSTFSDWPSASHVMPMYEPVAVAISYWADAGWTALPAESFVFFEHGWGAGIAPALAGSWPALAPVAGGPRVRVDVTAGPVDPATADACVKLFIKAMVAWWIDNPSAVAPGNMQPAPFLRSLLDPVRLWG